MNRGASLVHVSGILALHNQLFPDQTILSFSIYDILLRRMNWWKTVSFQTENKQLLLSNPSAAGLSLSVFCLITVLTSYYFIF